MKNQNLKNESKYQENNEKLNILAKICSERMGDLLEDLGVDLQISGNKYVGPCPIHGDSDNQAALNIYYDGYTVPGYWKCRTRGCEGKFGRNIIGFTRGCLSNTEKGYHLVKNPKAMYSFPDTLKYLCKFANVNLNDIKIDQKDLDRRRFITECISNEKVYKHEESLVSRQRVKNNLIFPAKYFIDRGYSENILNKFDVGVAKKSKVDTKDRIIVPIYNNKEYLIGYTCRSIFEKCPKCRLHHSESEDCPKDNHEKNLCSKWRHIGFEAQENLYNYWNAKQKINDTNTAILVEGPGDVWKLEESGIRNAVGMFGHTLYDGQERLLSQAQCMTMIILTDNDDAGLRGAEEIKRKYGRLYRMYFPKIDSHDVGDMNTDAITENVKPLIELSMSIYT